MAKKRINKKDISKMQNRCDRCESRFDTKKELDEHRFRIHGECTVTQHKKAPSTEVKKVFKKHYMPKKNNGKPKSTDNKDDIVILNGTHVYEYNRSKDCYENYTPKKPVRDRKNEKSYRSGDGKYHIRCENCHRFTTMLLDPYRSLRGYGRISQIRDYPLVLCPFCGLNLFKRNVERIQEAIFKGLELPSGIDKSLFKSKDVLKDEEETNEEEILEVEI